MKHSAETKRRWRRALVLACLPALMASGCGAPANPAPDVSPAAETAKDAPRITLLRTFNPPPADDHPYIAYVTEKTGVHPTILSISGDYTEGLQTLFAAGENIPDAFRPLNTGIDETLIEQDAALPLDDLLPQYAPHMWKNIPTEVWNIMRAASEDRKIYVIPQVYIRYAERGWFIRQDWLDKLGLEAPKTKEDLVGVLRAFRDNDPNGNGKKDEIPTGAIQGPNWLHGFFAMYGVPMFNSDPLWDLYDGKLRYSAVTQNARDALVFMRELYAEGLMDPESFLNTDSVWASKIQNDQVGLFYHVLHQADTYFFSNLYQKNPDAKIAAIAPPKAEGYDGFICRLQVANQDWMIPKSREANAPNVLKYLDWSETEEGRNFVAYGIEGETWDKGADGTVRYHPQKDSPELFAARYHGLKGLQANDDKFFIPNIVAVKPNGLGGMLAQAQEVTFAASKKIAGDGLPLSIYKGYPDHKTHKLFNEACINIITGEWPAEKFDDFVKEWYATGGAVIEQRANDWYARYKEIQEKIR